MTRSCIRPFCVVAALAVTPLATAQHGPATTARDTPAEAVPATPIEPAPQATPARQREERPLLRIGDAAPKPVLAEILKGNTAFDGFPKDKVTVMEFWATWCGPCLRGMPHLSELQEKYRDAGVDIIGVSREEPKTVKDFLAKPEWDEKTGYTIALDEESKTNNAFMRAARQNGIPCAFIVDQKGRVAWIGHPMTMDEPLDRILAGDWDLEAERTRFEQQEKVDQMMTAVRRGMNEGRRSGNYAKAVDAVEKALAVVPDDQNLRMMKFQLMVGPLDDPNGYELGWELLKANRENARMLNSIAWYVLDDASVKNRDLEFAMAVAKAANETSGGEDAAILDTLARAYFETGDLGRAIEIQEKAVERAPEGPMAEGIKEALERYRKAALDGAA